ncbi:hypothetical protein KFL_000170180 [Klebsormidium nitens]|uniref:Uncharacterized protein n=1 Tax=Klebsormidium nitens TaxID=105231 RepID=A0A1Y1HLX8_KLENI|nr:hypothetical protein KFL_000170180 [Klebsormidium nitens]|eukprot:GAQ78672.1 hypothetical protein KFL_000170180 [Klebsormidium nitens]
MREKERQLRISVSWFGKDLEASFFQNAQEDTNQVQLAGSNMSWVNNPMVMSALSMTPLYLLYVAFMVGCMNHGSFGGVPS